MLNKLKPVLALACLVVVSSCGGGSGSSGSSGGDAAKITCQLPQQLNVLGDSCIIKFTLYETSYENFKSYPTNILKYPRYINTIGANAGWESPPKSEVIPQIAYGDFKIKDELSFFVAFTNYAWWDIASGYGQSYSAATSNSKYLSDFTFWKINSDLSMTMISTFKGCLHPRKSIVADFNKDGKPDIFVACHGYDGIPFPGEKSKILLSNNSGNYAISDVGENAFTHGVSAGDVNGDGYPDIVTADLYFYINQKDGTFKRNDSLIRNLPKSPYNNPGYFNIELIDLNNDGILDIIAGGHEYNTQGADTKIWYGDKDGTFGKLTKTIPPVKGWGVVNDFTIIKSNGKNILYINRTTDPTFDSSGSWYQGSLVQRYNLDTGESILSDKLTTPNWVPWMIPKIQNGQIGVGPYDRAGFFQ